MSDLCQKCGKNDAGLGCPDCWDEPSRAVRDGESAVSGSGGATPDEREGVFHALDVLWNALPKSDDEDIAVGPKMALRLLKDAALRSGVSPREPEPAISRADLRSAFREAFDMEPEARRLDQFTEALAGRGYVIRSLGAK